MDLVGFSVSLVDGTDQALYYRSMLAPMKRRRNEEDTHVLGNVLEVTSVLEPRSTGRDYESRSRLASFGRKNSERENIL